MCIRDRVPGKHPYTKNDDGQAQPLKAEQPLTAEQQSKVVDYFNHLRAGEDAQKMAVITWNASLALQAAARAARCEWVFEYEAQNNTGHSEFLSSSNSFSNLTNPSEAINAWYSGKADYNYDAMKCADDAQCHTIYCEDYIQVVWATTTDVGCAIQHCPSTVSYTHLTLPTIYSV